MRNKKRIALFATLGIITLATATLLGFYCLPNRIHSNVLYTQAEVSQQLEFVNEEMVPLAAPARQTDDLRAVTAESTLAGQTKPVVNTFTKEPATEKPTPGEPAPIVPAPADPAPVEPTPEDPALVEPTSEEPAPADPAPVEPARAAKPDDVTNVESMAEYLYLAGCEFWATEKDFSGTTTRPVSTRVAPAIGSGTAVDCPGGDTVRVDDKGVLHDSYAIADHFREYVDMPDLKYFKLYLSDKDYTVSSYGAREEVVGAFYQYGSERAIYTPVE